MPDSLKVVGQFYPEKHALVSSIPLIWDFGLKKIVRSVHEWISPCTDCVGRDTLYDTMYDHLRDEQTTPSKSILKNVKNVSGNVLDITSSLTN